MILLFTKYFSGDHLKKNEMWRVIRYVCGTRGRCRVLVGRPDEKSPHGRPKPRWEDNIKVYLHEAGREGAWSGLISFTIETGGGGL